MPYRCLNMPYKCLCSHLAVLLVCSRKVGNWSAFRETQMDFLETQIRHPLAKKTIRTSCDSIFASTWRTSAIVLIKWIGDMPLFEKHFSRYSQEWRFRREAAGRRIINQWMGSQIQSFQILVKACCQKIQHHVNIRRVREKCFQCRQKQWIDRITTSNQTWCSAIIYKHFLRVRPDTSNLSVYFTFYGEVHLTSTGHVVSTIASFPAWESLVRAFKRNVN